jgi:hypothetical protein
VAEKRLHHCLSRLYLRGFTDPLTPQGHTPYLWVPEVLLPHAARTPSQLFELARYRALIP